MDIIRHPGAAVMIPLFNKNTILLIRQFRHALGDFIWEIPTGTLKAREKAIDCAKRELTEETGYSAKEWHKIGEIIPLPAYSDARMHIFIAADLVPAEQKLDKDELLDVHQIKFDDAIDMIHKGEIQDSKTISGLFIALHWLKQNKNNNSQMP
jgi:ADP-ribose pyrophosphatase